MPAPDSEDALLADCSVERIKAIAKSMDLTSYSRLRKEELIAFISTAMLQITECPTCGGGQCQPTEHYFAPVQQMHSTTSSPDHNALANIGTGDLQDELFGGDGVPPFSFITGQQHNQDV